MGRDGVLRSVVVPSVISTAVTVGFLVCLLRALSASRFTDGLQGGYGGIGAVVAVSIMGSVADRRSLQQTKSQLPSSLSTAQRDQVLRAVRSGPLPPDPLVRAEARRLAEQRAAARGDRPRTTVAVLAALSAVLALAGAVWSHWWWGDAALVAALAALIRWRDRRLRQHLRTLQREVQLPSPAEGGIHRLLDLERRPELVTSNRALLELDLRKPWNGSTAPPLVRINNALVASEWGNNAYLLPAGRAVVSASSQYLTEYGLASTTVTTSAGDHAALYYTSPALALLDGRIGPRPQRSSGLRGLTVLALAFVGLIIVLMITDP